jgi:hypothetical protein
MKPEELFRRMMSGEPVWFWYDDCVQEGHVTSIKKRPGEPDPTVSVIGGGVEVLSDMCFETEDACRIARAMEILNECDFPGDETR